MVSVETCIEDGGERQIIMQTAAFNMMQII